MCMGLWLYGLVALGILPRARMVFNTIMGQDLASCLGLGVSTRSRPVLIDVYRTKAGSQLLTIFASAGMASELMVVIDKSRLAC